MFTGIVEELGTVESLEDQGDAVRLTVRGPLVTARRGAGRLDLGQRLLPDGGSTGRPGRAETFTADVMHETLAKTSLGALEPGTRVNLERAVTPTTRLGGHIVQGHVDGTGTVVRRTPSEHWELVEISLPAELERYLVREGLDHRRRHLPDRRRGGRRSAFTVSLIPETLARTTLGFKQPGDVVNLEVDVIAKYVEKMVKHDDRHDRPTGQIRLDGVEDAIADIAAGKAVVVVDDEDRENEGDIIFAASKATPELMAFTIRHSSGVICVPMPADMLDRLEIPLMTPHNKDRLRTAYTISVDARDGVTTGISAADRAHTARVLADSATEPWEITRPGHVFPLRYREGGVLVRRGHTEAAVDLARMAGLTPAGVLVEVVNDDGTMKRGQRPARRSPTSTA